MAHHWGSQLIVITDVAISLPGAELGLEAATADASTCPGLDLAVTAVR